MKNSLAALIISFMFFSPVWSETSSLVVTIHQKDFGLDKKIFSVPMLSAFIKSLPLKDWSEFGEALNQFEKVVTLSKYEGLVVDAWDQARADFIRKAASGRYTNIYIVTGKDINDAKKMKEIWQDAIKNDVVDYVALVHGGDQWIKDEWKVPKGKLRMVYSEGCEGGSGKSAFVDAHGARVAAGHNDRAKSASPSPFFSFSFLTAWFGGNTFIDALNYAWKSGEKIIKSEEGFKFASVLSRYSSVKDALDAATIKYSWKVSVDPKAMSIKTFPTKDEAETASKETVVDF